MAKQEHGLYFSLAGVATHQLYFDELLVQQGKVRYLGMTEAAPATIRRDMPFIQLLPYRQSTSSGVAIRKMKSCPLYEN
jgi:hypothetical protein